MLFQIHTEYFGKKIRDCIVRNKLYNFIGSNIDYAKDYEDLGYRDSKRFYMYNMSPLYFEELMGIDPYKLYKIQDRTYKEVTTLNFNDFDFLKNSDSFYRYGALTSLAFLRICRLYNLKWRV
jgi:hypothetical protein